MLNKNIEEKICISMEMLYVSLYTFLMISSLIFLGSHCGLLLFVASFYFASMIVYINYKRKKHDRIDEWKEYDAQLVDARTIKCVCFSTFKVRGNQKEVYKPEIEYTYIYKGEERISSQYAWSYDDMDCNFSYARHEAENIVDSMKKSPKIKIHVNQNTGESAISLDKARGYGIPYIE